MADTSELFMRSLQMYNLFSVKKVSTARKVRWSGSDSSLERIDTSVSIDSLSEMKIGAIVCTVLKKMLEQGVVSAEEVKLMQMKEYSKETFDIQYPLLMPVQETNGRRLARYYFSPITVHGKSYFLYSEWYEVPANNDRPYLLRWLALHAEH